MIIIIIIMIIIIELIIRSLGRHISPQERPYYDWKSGGLYLGPKAMMLMMMILSVCSNHYSVHYDQLWSSKL